MPFRPLPLLLGAALASCFLTPQAAAAPPVGDDINDRMGLTQSFLVGYTNSVEHDWGSVWTNMKAGVTRIAPDRSTTYWDQSGRGGQGAARVEALDREVKLAFANNRTQPVVQFIFLPSFEEGRQIQDIDWFELGRAFAARYRVDSDWNLANTGPGYGIRRWMILNEIDAPWYHPGYSNGRIVDPQTHTKSLNDALAQYRKANADFAAGVRASDPAADVFLGPLATGWVDESYPYQAGRWITEARDLLLSRGPERLDGFGFHSYPSTRLTDQDGFHRRMDPQWQYDRAIQQAGLWSVSPSFYTTEIGVQVADIDGPGPGPRFRGARTTLPAEEQVLPAQLMLPLIWNNLAVRHSSGPRWSQPANVFTSVFSPFSINRGNWVSLAEDARWHLTLNNTFSPNSRGRVYQLVSQLGAGMSITRVARSADNAELTAEGGGKTLHVRMHYPDDPYTDRTSWALWVPPQTRRAQVFYWDSTRWLPKQAPQGLPTAERTIDLQPFPWAQYISVPVRPGETVMLLLSTDEQAPFPSN